MDDLRASLGTFDPDAPLGPAPDPWDSLPMPALRAGPPWAMAEMIAAEPALAGRIVGRLVADGSAAALAEALRAAAAASAPVVITGCGTSEHAAQGAAEILRAAWRDAGLAGPGPVAAQAFELALDPPRGGLVIGVSHEGGTAATIAAMDAAAAAGARTALLTASAGSPAAAGAGIVLATVEMDRSWCHTVGYVSPLVAAIVVGDRLAGRETDGPSLGRQLRAGIDAAHAARPVASVPAGSATARPDARIADGLAAVGRLLVIASGTDRVAARELVLKVEEAAWLPSAMRDLETFLHGHLPATGPDTGLVLVLTERAGAAARTKRARQALAAAREVGIRTAAILDAGASSDIPPELTSDGRIVIAPVPGVTGPAASLLGSAGALQLLTLEIARARGTNPDQIRRDDARYLRAAELADDPDR